MAIPKTWNGSELLFKSLFPHAPSVQLSLDSDKFVVEKIVDTTGTTTEKVDNPDAASVEKNDSEELGDGRPDELIIGKVLSSLEITQVEKKLEKIKPVAFYSPDRMSVEKDDLEDGSSERFGTEGDVGTPKIAQVETKLEPNTSGPTKEAVDSLDPALVEKDEFEDPENRGSGNKNNPTPAPFWFADKLIS